MTTMLNAVRIMRIVACSIVVIVFTIASASASEPLRMVKTVPEAATIEYRVRGVVVQSAPLAPGVYEIVVRELESGAGLARRAARKERK